MAIVGWQNDIGADGKSVEGNREGIFRNVGESEYRAFHLFLQGTVSILMLVHNHAPT